MNWQRRAVGYLVLVLLFFGAGVGSTGGLVAAPTARASIVPVRNVVSVDRCTADCGYDRRAASVSVVMDDAVSASKTAAHVAGHHSSLTRYRVAAEGEAAAARSTNFIVHPNGDVVPVPDGAVGPTAVDSGKGFQFTGGSGGHGLDPRTTDVRIMDPVTTGKHQYPDGYVSYSNGSGQAVNPYTGQTVGKADPWWHWPF